MNLISENRSCFEMYKEINALKTKSFQKTILKTMTALALLVAGVAFVVFLNLNFLPYGAGLILISSVAIYQYLKDHYHSLKTFSRAAKAVSLDF